MLNCAHACVRVEEHQLMADPTILLWGLFHHYASLGDPTRASNMEYVLRAICLRSVVCLSVALAILSVPAANSYD